MENLNKQREEAWERNYRLLCQFIEAYERLPKVRECYKGKAIGSWYAQQKTKLKNTEYPAEYKDRLATVVKEELEYKNYKIIDLLMYHYL